MSQIFGKPSASGPAAAPVQVGGKFNILKELKKLQK
jgi:hypothetical protein